MNKHIGIKPPDQYGVIYAWLHPSDAASDVAAEPHQTIRRVQTSEDVEALKREWGTDDVRGDGIPYLKQN